MRCATAGCPHPATDTVHGVQIKLPGHRDMVNVGSINVCPACKGKMRVGLRTSIREDIVASAFLRGGGKP